MNAQVRRFETGATRDLDQDKYDYEAFLSPLVIERYAEYMHKNRKLSDGTMREGDNWQQGIPLSAYMKSGTRHHIDWWKEHRGHATKDGLEDALCAVIFNASGYLHELRKARLLSKQSQAAIDIIRPHSADALVEQLLPPGSAPGDE